MPGPWHLRMRLGSQSPHVEPTTHHTTVFGVCALEMACDAQDGFPEVSYQFRLLDVLGLERLQVVLPWKPQRTMAGVAPASLPLQLQVSCGSMQGSEDGCPQFTLPSHRLGWGALWSLGGKEPLNPAWNQLPQQFSPKSREVMPDFLRWVLRRTTCRVGAVGGSRVGRRVTQHWRELAELLPGPGSHATSSEMATASSKHQKCGQFIARCVLRPHRSGHSGDAQRPGRRVLAQLWSGRAPRGQAREGAAEQERLVGSPQPLSGLPQGPPPCG